MGKTRYHGLRTAGIATSLVIAIPLTGCASFDGMPRPTVSERELVKQASEISIGAALSEINHATDPVKMAQIRNRKMSTFLAAIDARYRSFRAAISSNMKGGNFGLDLAVLGLGGIGATVKSAATEMSAATTALTGARASLNREVYMQQTLPAVVNSMEAGRLAIRREIIQGMNQGISVYPFERGLSDIVRYDMAGSLDGALAAINAEARKYKAAEQEDYSAAVLACTPTMDAIYRRLDLMSAIAPPPHTPAGDADLGKIVASVAPSVAATRDENLEILRDTISEKLCDTESVNKFAAKWNLILP